MAASRASGDRPAGNGVSCWALPDPAFPWAAAAAASLLRLKGSLSGWRCSPLRSWPAVVARVALPPGEVGRSTLLRLLFLVAMEKVMKIE